MRLRIKQLILVTALTLASSRAFPQSQYLDWLDYHVVGSVNWVLQPGHLSAYVSVRNFYNNSDVGIEYFQYSYAGFQGISGRANARAMLGVNIQDQSTLRCSGFTVKLKVAHTGFSCTLNASCQSGGPSWEEYKVYDTCNGSNLNYFSSSWFGFVGNNPIIVGHNEVPVIPAAGVNCYTVTVTMMDDWGTTIKTGCYRAYYN